MSFYHGSKNSNLKVLKKNHSKDGYVYATTSRLVALTYATRSFPNLFVTDNGKVCFFELIPNLFEKMTKSKKGYIYTLKNIDFEIVQLQKNKCAHNNCWLTNHDVQIESKETIEDIYVELYIHRC